MKEFIDKLYDTGWGDLTNESIEASRKVLLDTVGAMIAGSYEEQSKDLISQMSNDNLGKYNVVGSNQTFNLSTAGFINGSAAVAVELDEGNQWSKGHPAAHIVPTLLTYIQKKSQFNGKSFLLNLIKSYEVCSRFGRATTLLPDAHAHGTWGVPGATASVSFIEDIKSEELLDVLNISASFSMPTMWESALGGKLIRNVYVGQAVESAIKSIDLLKAGYYAPENAVKYIYGNVLGTEFDTSVFKNQLYHWDIEKNYFKDHAFCRYAHAPLDALKKLVKNHVINTADIKEIKVWTYSRAATLNNKSYNNTLSAKYSIPFALADWLNTRRSDHSVFDEKTLKNPDIRKLAENVNVYPSEELEKNYPTIMPAKVEIILNTGQSYSHQVDQADTGLGENVTFKHLEEKFRVNTNQISTKKQDRIIDYIMNIENQNNVTDFIKMLS